MFLFTLKKDNVEKQTKMLIFQKGFFPSRHLQQDDFKRRAFSQTMGELELRVREDFNQKFKS